VGATTIPPRAVETDFAAWRLTKQLAPEIHWRLRTELALSGFKWDAQVGDVCSLAPFAVILPAATWAGLAMLAENLARELENIERALLERPQLWPKLGMPKKVLAALTTGAPWTPSAARVMRFDFHPTKEGWKISEVNSDVPGGFTESSRFARRMAELSAADATVAGDPTQALCDALARRADRFGRIALVAAPGYIEDQQIVAHLADVLKQRRIEGQVAAAEQICWLNGCAHVRTGEECLPVDLIYRFYQAEWMTRLPGWEWTQFFRGGVTPVCNPPGAVLSESKRLPVLWDSLNVPLPFWKALLPSTLSVAAPFRFPRERWVLKEAYSNTGDSVYAANWDRRAYLRALTQGAWAPRRWIAQAAFDGLPLRTPLGEAQVCVGVYVVEGQASGIYGRLSLNNRIDYRALDVAILIRC
jgi:glutathionylspermidine synthase